ncbi:efflux RND transporter permease subunit [Candidatus Pyrohabitans sp.]
MLKRALKVVAELHLRHPLTVLLVALLITGIALNGITKVRVETNMEKWMPQDMPAIETTKLIRSIFGTGEMEMVLVGLDRDYTAENAVYDIRDPRVWSAIAQLENQLVKERNVYGVSSALSGIMRYNGGEIPSTPEQMQVLLDEHPELKEYFARDFSSTIIIFTTDIGYDEKSAEELIKRVEEDIAGSSFPGGVKARITGMPSFVRDWFVILSNDTKRTAPISLFIVLVALIAIYASVRWGLVAISPLIFGMIWTGGAMGYLGIPLNMVTSAFGSLLVGIATADAIHFVDRYREEKEAGNTHEDSLKISVMNVGPPIIATSVTTIGGFGALLFGTIPMNTQFGAVLVLGILFALIASLFMLPSLLYLLDERSHKQITKKTGLWAGPRNALRKAGEFEAAYPLAVLSGVLLFTIISIPGIASINVVLNYEKMLPSTLETIQTMHTVQDRYGGSDMVQILLEAEDVREPSLIRAMDVVENRLKKEEGVTDVSSLAGVVMDRYGYLPSSMAAIKKVVDSDPRARALVSRDYKFALINVRVNIPYEPAVEMDLIKRVRESIEDAGLEARLSGMIALDVDSYAVFGNDLGIIGLAGIVLVLSAVMLYFRSITRGLLVLVPVVLAITWTSGWMGYLGIPFSFISVGLIPILFGLGVDYGIHIINRYEEEMSKGKSAIEALLESVSTVGLGLIIVTFTTVAGFLGLLASALPSTQQMGQALALGIFFSLLAAFSTVPPALILKENLKGR